MQKNFLMSYRQFSRSVLPEKYQISRSAPPVLYPSTNDYFLNMSFPVIY